jgi:hypothetical protein
LSLLISIAIQCYLLSEASRTGASNLCNAEQGHYHNGGDRAIPGFTWLDTLSVDTQFTHVTIMFQSGLDCSRTALRGGELNGGAHQSYAGSLRCDCLASTSVDNPTILWFPSTDYRLAATNTYLAHPPTYQLLGFENMLSSPGGWAQVCLYNGNVE